MRRPSFYCLKYQNFTVVICFWVYSVYFNTDYFIKLEKSGLKRFFRAEQLPIHFVIIPFKPLIRYADI
jgi:hypothetical protein